MASVPAPPLRRSAPVLVVAALLLAILPFVAADVSAQEDRVLVQRQAGGIIVNGVVRGDSETVTTVGGMHLVTELQVTSEIEGEAPERLLVETPGGVTAAGVRQIVSHQPSFSDGDEVQLSLAASPQAEGGVIGALWDGERLPVYSVVGGMSGVAWLNGPPTSQIDELVPGTLSASGDYSLHGGSWGGFPVNYSINPVGAPAGAIDAVRRAADTWEAVPGTGIGFTYTGTTNSAAPVGDFDNVVAWITPSNPADTYLAQATWWMAAGNTIVAFDIVFNRNYSIVVDAAGSSFDLESVALHEFGHVLGLGHVNATSERMYPSITAGVQARNPGSGDRAGMQAMYDAPAAPTPTPTPTPTPSPTSSPTPSPTPIPTSTPVPTSTPIPTATPTPSPTSTPTPGPTATPTVTPTPSPIPSPTPTSTPTVTPTPSPTPSPTPKPESGTIKGTVTLLGDGSPIFAAHVCAKLLLPAREYCTYSRTDGQYTIRDIPAGNYSVFVTDPAKRYVENCAGEQSCDNPYRFGISPTQGVTNIDVAMDGIYSARNPTPTPDPRIGEGRIEGRISSKDSSVAGIAVCATGQRLLVNRCTVTAADGTYAIGDLPTDNYKVEIGDGDTCFATSAIRCADFTPVGVVSPLTRTNINQTI